MNTTIRVAHTRDLTYIDKLQRQNAGSVSFYPLAALERAVPGHLLLVDINGEPGGYLYHGSFEGVCPIFQACIDYDARRAQHGADLVQVFVAICTGAGTHAIALRCGSELDANFFWGAMGFKCVGITKGGLSRRRDINAWRLEIQPALFALPALPPSQRRIDTTLWRKARKMGASTSQFVRGEGTRAYREYLENVVQEPNL